MSYLQLLPYRGLIAGFDFVSIKLVNSKSNPTCMFFGQNCGNKSLSDSEFCTYVSGSDNFSFIRLQIDFWFQIGISYNFRLEVVLSRVIVGKGGDGFGLETHLTAAVGHIELRVHLRAA